MCHSSNEPSLPCNYKHEGLASLTTTGWNPRFYKISGWLCCLHVTYPTAHRQRSGDEGEAFSFLATLCWSLHSQGRKNHYKILCCPELNNRICVTTTVWLISLQIFEKMRFELSFLTVILLHKSEGALNSSLRMVPWVSYVLQTLR